MILTAVTFFIILSILVFVHEFGHYIVARLIGVRVEEFGFGLPPRIWGKKVGKTIYSMNWLPIGGFVKLAGEDDQDEETKGIARHEYFWAKSKKQRAAVLLAGVTMNFLLAVLITGFLLTQGVPEHSGRVRVDKVSPSSPASQAGLKTGDQIVSMTYKVSGGKTETKPFTQDADLIDTTKKHLGEQVVITIKRGESTFEKTVTPRKQVPQGQGPLGVSISDIEIKKYPLSEVPYKAVEVNISRSREMLAGLGILVYRLVTLQPISADVSGPIGIARVTGQAVKFGWLAVLEFMSILSLNLAVINILPIPALDGGRLLFVILEKILGKRVKPTFERNAHQIGMIILIGLILVVSIFDILKIAQGV